MKCPAGTLGPGTSGGVRDRGFARHSTTLGTLAGHLPRQKISSEQADRWIQHQVSQVSLLFYSFFQI